MGATYTRQSSSAIVDGGIIEAADINAEFNQILAAFEQVQDILTMVQQQKVDQLQNY